jgi:hypothetical protein
MLSHGRIFDFTHATDEHGTCPGFVYRSSSWRWKLAVLPQQRVDESFNMTRLKSACLQADTFQTLNSQWGDSWHSAWRHNQAKLMKRNHVPAANPAPRTNSVSARLQHSPLGSAPSCSLN